MTVLHADSNNPLLIQQLELAGYKNIEAYDWSMEDILKDQHAFEGLVIRSRFDIDKSFLDSVPNLKFIARVGAGLESIDVEYARERGVALFSAPEGNRNAVAEHSLGMLLSLFNKLNKADREVRRGFWNRESNRGIELDGKTVGIIGYGNMGKAFAKKLRGFDVRVLCYDIKAEVGDENAVQVDLDFFKEQVDVVSLHTPWTPQTNKMIDSDFIEGFKNPFWFINTARGKSVVTADLVSAMIEGKILGAGLDVLEYEKSSFENLFAENHVPEPLQELMYLENVILSPHVAGWTIESHEKLATTIAQKIITEFGNFAKKKI